jgi:hypothetical protein
MKRVLDGILALGILLGLLVGLAVLPILAILVLLALVWWILFAYLDYSRRQKR